MTTPETAAANTLEVRIEAIVGRGRLPVTNEQWIAERRGDTHEAVENLLFVNEAVDALTSREGHDIRCELSGRSYRSHDFRDHPEAEKHLETLRSHWGAAEHPTHRTLEVLQLLASYREKLSDKIKTWWRWGVQTADSDFTHEAIWRRIRGLDIISVGFTHHPEYYEKHQAFLKELVRHAGAVIIEGHGNQRVGDSMAVRWAMQDDEDPYTRIMRDAVAVNPDIVFFDIDPRNDGYTRYDEMGDAPELPDAFVEAFYTHLTTQDPSLRQKLRSPADLRFLLRLNAEKNHERLIDQTYVLHRGAMYCPHPSIDLQDGRAALSREPTGLEIGNAVYGDAASAFHLHLLPRLLKGGTIPVRGPIIDLIGADHMASRKRFIDHPDQAARTILLHPHLAFLPDKPPVDRPFTEEENRQHIAEHLSAKPFALNPFEDDPPAGLYRTLGFAVARIDREGRLEFVPAH